MLPTPIDEILTLFCCLEFAPLPSMLVSRLEVAARDVCEFWCSTRSIGGRLTSSTSMHVCCLGNVRIFRSAVFVVILNLRSDPWVSHWGHVGDLTSAAWLADRPVSTSQTWPMLCPGFDRQTPGCEMLARARSGGAQERAASLTCNKRGNAPWAAPA